MLTGGRIVIWSALLAAALAAAAMAVAAVSGVVTGEDALRKLFDSLVTLAGAVVLTGVIGVTVDRATKARESRDQLHAQRLELARRLRSVHSDVKHAALLIAAHQTARTYGEQMRALLRSRVEIGDVRFEIVNDVSLSAGSRDLLVKDLSAVAGYLEALTDEYGDQYLRVSAIQLATHEWELRRARALADREQPPDAGEVVVSPVPWQELNRPDAFPCLAVLLESLDDETVETASAILHAEQFSQPLRRVADALSK